MNMDEKVKYIRAIEALRSGVPNHDAVMALGCNQSEIEAKFQNQLEDTSRAISHGVQNKGMIVAGDFGSGKSHLLEYLMHRALEQNFVCSKIVISKETPLFDPVKLFRAAIEGAVVPQRLGSALTEIATKLNPKRDSYKDFYIWTQQKHDLNARFAATLFLYERTKNDPEFSNKIIRFWAGDKISSGEIRRNLKLCNERVSYEISNIPQKELALQRFKFIARLIAAAGYAGWVLLVDETELIGRYSLLQRAKSYAEFARLTGYLDQESDFAGLTAVFSITTDFHSAILEERDDINKIPAKLEAKGTKSDLLLARQASKGMQIIQNELRVLRQPNKEVLKQIYEKLRAIHAKAYNWEPPPVKTVEHLITTQMRQYIKAWITEWDFKRLDEDYQPEIEVTPLAIDYTEDRSLEVETEGDEFDK